MLRFKKIAYETCLSVFYPGKSMQHSVSDVPDHEAAGWRFGFRIGVIPMV